VENPAETLPISYRQSKKRNQREMKKSDKVTKLKKEKVKENEQSKKSEIVEKIVRLARKERLSYDDFIYVCQQARKKLGLCAIRARKNVCRRFSRKPNSKNSFRSFPNAAISSTRLCSNCFSIPPSGSASWSK
jgi:hypothetical protein